MTEGAYRRRADALIKKLLEAKNEAAALEMWRTFHGIDGATTAVGWELADKLKVFRRAEQ